MKTHVSSAAAIAIAVCAFACDKRQDQGAAATPRPSAEPSATVASATAAPDAGKTQEQARGTYNVVLIMIDSLRADMPWTGYSRPIAPWLTAFEKRVTSYPRGYSLSSYTAKSVVPALAGKYPSELHRDGRFFERWHAKNVVVTELAKERGVRTLAGHAHGYFLPGFGPEQGVDDYRLLPGTFLDTTGVANITSEALNKLAKEMLSAQENTQLPEGRRFFAYFHFLDPHYTYFKHEGHPDFGRERRDIYDNEVHYTDKWVGDLVDWSFSQPWGKNTAFIITADHGEGFGEHNHLRHAYELWEALVRVPLFIYVPGAKPRRLDVPRSHIDLAPTIAELLGVEPSSEFRGKSLIREVFGAPAEERPVLVDMPRSDLMDRRRALVVGDYKLIAFGDDASFQLYNVKEDFKEENELSKSHPEKLAEMRALYKELSGQVVTLPVSGDKPLKGAPSGRRW